MQDFEKLGAFYLGKRYDVGAGELADDLVLYDAKDLTTHAVIIGMTGSGKTGLGIGLLEEAALDRIPVIALDPKGDLGNLLLSFPELKPDDFRPWINEREAADKGLEPAAFAQKQAELWRNGLADWGQDGERIRRLREAADLAIYTPGSSAGLEVSVLRSFAAPSPALREDADLYRERIQATATGVLALLDINADPITSREHILLSNILEKSWDADRDLDVSGLIQAIQKPPLEKVGVMDLEAFFPAKERFELAMGLNNLLAAPGFEAWMEGEPLDVGRLLYTESGGPRVSVMSIAHLPEAERMFFVSMLLNELIGWMRCQQGTSSLRAILYMDEVFGYLPPTANPPSKPLFLTLLKQARAYGLGLVLATQNPVDLDYKALSNAGTWCIGRLQTERDKARVMEGLEGAAAGGNFDKQRMEQLIAGLGKRVFLLHNVHETAPVVFHTRWAMSYLPGPFTRDQIKTLMAERKRVKPTAAEASAMTETTAATENEQNAPVLAPGIDQYFLPLGRDADGELIYQAGIIGAAKVRYESRKHAISATRDLLHLIFFEDGPVPLDWAEAETLAIDVGRLEQAGRKGAAYAACPAPANDPKNYSDWEKRYQQWLRGDNPLTVLYSQTLDLVSEPGEDERAFRIRLQQAAREARDAEVRKLRKKFASRLDAQQKTITKAQQKLARESEQANQQQLSAAVSVGTALLGAFLGRKGVGSVSRAGTAAKGLGRIGKERGDVARAEQDLQRAQQALAELEIELQDEVEAQDDLLNAQAETLEQIEIRPKSNDVQVQLLALIWAPYYRGADGFLTPAWAKQRQAHASFLPGDGRV